MKERRELSGLFLLLFISIIIIGTFALTMSDTGKNREHYEELNEGWLVSINGESHPDVAMEQFVFPLADRGDEFVLETKMPERVIDNPILVFFSVHAVITAEIDGQEIYRYGQELYEAGKLIGYGYQCISLPEDYAGKTLRIRLNVCEDAAFSSFDVPKLYDANWYVKDYLKENRVPLIINLFLIVFGFCMVGVALGFMIGIRSFRWIKLLWMALFSIEIGLWSLCSYNLMFLFYDNPSRKSFTEFITLYLLPLSVFAYFHEEAAGAGGKVRKAAYYAILLLQTCFIITACILQFTGVCRFPQVLRLQHIIMGMMMVYLIGMFVSDIRHKRMKNTVLFVGIVTMILFAVVDLLRFNFEKYISMESGQQYVGVFSIGVMIFIAAMLIDFSQNIIHALYDGARSEALEKLAYTDELTGLSNRRACEEAMDELDAGESGSYAIGVFDLNNLKQVNDRFGHEEGDEFIKAFGVILSEAFSECGFVGRTGGDEFMVILHDVTREMIDNRLAQMQEKMLLKNREHKHWGLSTAYGVCESKEAPDQAARELYRIADERMYACKQEMKKGRAESVSSFV